MEPKKYLGDNFSRVTQIFRVSHYNVACCYSSINQARPAPASKLHRRSERREAPERRALPAGGLGGRPRRAVGRPALPRRLRRRATSFWLRVERSAVINSLCRPHAPHASTGPGEVTPYRTLPLHIASVRRAVCAGRCGPGGAGDGHELRVRAVQQDPVRPQPGDAAHVAQVQGAHRPLRRARVQRHGRQVRPLPDEMV